MSSAHVRSFATFLLIGIIVGAVTYWPLMYFGIAVLAGFLVAILVIARTSIRIRLWGLLTGLLFGWSLAGTLLWHALPGEEGPAAAPASTSAARQAE